MWNSIVGFFAQIIDVFYSWTGNFGVAIIIFTVLVKLILLPLDLKSKSSTAKMQALAPEMQKINEKYANDPEKKNKKITELYAKNNVSPLGGCLPVLLTFPIIILMFAALRKIAGDYMFKYLEELLIANDGSMREFLDEIGAAIASSGEMGKKTFRDILPILFNNSGNLTDDLSKLPEVITQEKFDALSSAIKAVTFTQAEEAAKAAGYNFLWIKNIWAPDSMIQTVLGTKCALFSKQTDGTFFANGWFVLSILSTAGQYLQTYLLTRGQKKTKKPANDPSQSMNFMNKVFPLITLFICATYNAAFAIYYTVSSIVAILQTLITDYIKKKKAQKASQEVINL